MDSEAVLRVQVPECATRGQGAEQSTADAVGDLDRARDVGEYCGVAEE